MLRALIEKAYSMQEQMDDVSKGMEILRQMTHRSKKKSQLKF